MGDPQQEGAGEEALGCVMFKGPYKDICFTNKRIIQFEVMRDRWKFLVNATLSPKPMVVDRSMGIGDVAPFVKSEVLRSDVSRIEVKGHGRFTRGVIRVVKKSGQSVDLARIDVDVDKQSFVELCSLVSSIYPEIPKNVG